MILGLGSVTRGASALWKGIKSSALTSGLFGAGAGYTYGKAKTEVEKVVTTIKQPFDNTIGKTEDKTLLYVAGGILLVLLLRR